MITPTTSGFACCTGSTRVMSGSASHGSAVRMGDVSDTSPIRPAGIAMRDSLRLNMRMG